MAAGKKTGGRVAGTPNKRKRQAVVAEAIARVGETIPDAFAGDAHALLIATYKNPNLDPMCGWMPPRRQLPYEKPRLQAVTLANEGGEPLKVRSELEIGRRLAFRARADRARRGEGEDAEGRASIGCLEGP